MLNDGQRATVLGIVGNSAAGKTTLAGGLADIIGRERCALICADDYHRFTRLERLAQGLSPADPRNNHLDILEQHLWTLRTGKPILKPVYDHATGLLTRPEYVEPKPYVIVEGLLCYNTRGLRDCFDVKLYLEPDERLRERWKLERDVLARGYALEEARKLLARSKRDGTAFILPQRLFADIVIAFLHEHPAQPEADSELSVRHILRPTLPHPDITPLLEPNVRNGLSLELSRDHDGKPVDLLEIEGHIGPRDARRLEDLLWLLLPETSAVRANFGVISAGRKAKLMSHPLALSELLIAYHLEMAAEEMRRAGSAGK
jgi:phosphoribulokinase